MSRSLRGERARSWDAVAGELWERFGSVPDEATLTRAMRGRQHRSFGDRGADAVASTRDAALKAVNPQIGHAVAAVWADHDREQRLEQTETPDRAPRAADAPDGRSRDVWGFTAIVLALTAVGVLASSTLVGSDSALFDTDAAIILSAVLTLSAVLCLLYFEPKRKSGKAYRAGLFPVEHLLLVPVLGVAALVWGLVRMVVDGDAVEPLTLLAVVVQSAAVTGGVLVWRRAHTSRVQTATTVPPSPPRLAGEINADRARARESVFIAKLTPEERDAVIGVQLHLLRASFRTGDLTTAGLAAAITALRSTWSI